MNTATSFAGEKTLSAYSIRQPLWQRIILLTILGYEGAGALAGGILLMLKPDGQLMDMPVEIMHGIFSNFLIPGVILFGLGILSSWAFIAVVRRTALDWLWAAFALFGFVIWFETEIIILKALHWLHLMWGTPVLLGLFAAIPLIALRNDRSVMKRVLLFSGILSSLWYIAINIYVPFMDVNYSVASYTVSELSAIGAPTRVPWVLMAVIYPILFTAFGWGVVKFSSGNKALHVTGILILIYSVINFYWPPMHLRGITPTLTDTMHITWAMVVVLFMMLMMGFGAAAFGKSFRIYTIISMVLLFGFGMLTARVSPNIPKGGPTPMIGVWERINIGLFLVWVIALAIMLLRKYPATNK